MTQKKEYSYKYIQFTVSESFKNKIDTYSEKMGFTTNSDFIREAIKEKIRRFENPELFQQSSSFNEEKYKLLLENTEKILNLQQELNTRYEIVESLNKNRQALQNEYNKLKEKGNIVDHTGESNIIEELLRSHTSLSVQQISEMIDLEPEIIQLVLNVFEKFKLNITTGRWELR